MVQPCLPLHSMFILLGVECLPEYNATSPCLFNVNDDQAETKNVATLFPSVVNTLQELLAKATPYVDGTMDPTVLASHYIQIADPADHWRNYSGPCYLRRTGLGYG